MLFSTVVLEMFDGTRFAVGGLSLDAARSAVGFIEARRAEAGQALAKRVSDDLEEVATAARFLFARQGWLRHAEVQALRPSMIKATALLSQASIWMDEGQQRVADFVTSLLSALDARRRQHNEAYAVEEIPRTTKLIQDAFQLRNPPTEEQARAAVTAEDCTLVLAGAGTGKTTAIVGKVAHLVTSRRVRGEEILVLAFNSSAAAEVKDRLKSLPGVQVRTFHAFGRSVIASATGKQPSVASFAEDEAKLRPLLRRFIEESVRDPATGKRFLNFFLSHQVPYRSAFEFSTPGEYYDYVRSCELRALSGDRVKSLEELAIANFLAVNAVRFEYEAPYEARTSSAQHRQYKPDFYLPDHGIYIEHYGVDRAGNTAPGIDRQRYHDGVAWKRELHRANGTTCLETFTYQRQEGTLLDALQQQLDAHGVALKPIDYDWLLARLQEFGAIDRLTETVATFLSHFKGSAVDSQTLKDRAKTLPDTARLLAFIDVFVAVFEHYQRELERRQEVDFHDLIGGAAEALRSGRVALPYKHVLVDEFQDISAGRAALLKAIVEATSSELFAVGDDWQSIYGFAGSDISILRHCDVHFGYTEQLLLSRTFRYGDSLQAVSSRFVTTNPAQIKRDLRADRNSAGAGVRVVWSTDVQTAIGDALAAIADESPGASVLVLGRYRRSEHAIPRTRNSLNVKFSTVHAAKGAEADYVIVLDLKDGRTGFPSQIADDPILRLVLPEAEAFPHAEERRLFYVALTRARQAAYLIADQAQPSIFVRELRDANYQVTWLGDGPSLAVPCPDCKTGSLRPSQSGQRYVCSKSPLCSFQAIPCPACGEGALLAGAAAVECTNPTCRKQERLCPRCRRGQVVRRQGRFGEFFGCTQFFAEPPCSYTMQG